MNLPKPKAAYARLLSVLALLAGAPAALAANGDVLISQFRVDGPSGGNDEFVEIVNSGNSSVAIGGWTLQGCAAGSGARSSRVTVAAGTTLAPGQYFLFTNSTAGAYTGGITGDATYATGFANSGSSGIALVASTSTSAAAVDSVGMGTGVCVEGTALTTVAGTNGFSRKNTASPATRAGLVDTNSNASDFQSGTGTIHNTGSAALPGAGGGAQPSVSLAVSPASFAENGGSATVTAKLSAATSSAVTINLAFGGTATYATDYSASATAISIQAGATQGQITLSAINDSVYEGDESVIVSISGTPTNATTGSPSSVTATIVDDDPMPPPMIGARIYQIQGSGHVSPMAGKSVSNVPGIVTAIASNGFYMQDGDGDNNPNTSDAILVFTSTAPTVTVGQQVLVSGTVTEFRPSSLATNLSTTEIASPTITSASNLFTNNSIAPVVIGSGGRLPPTDVIDDDSKGNVETSTTRVFDPTREGIDFYESLEGMLVRINNPVSTDRTPAASGAATIWVVGDNGANATGRNARGGVTLVERSSGVDYNPEHIQIFTGLPNTNPGTAVSFNVGDQLASFNGVVSYFGGNYEILPTTTPALATAASTVRGTSSLAAGGNRLTVGGYNVENLTVGDPQSKFDGLAADIVVAMGAPDIVSISEVQDNNGTTDAGVVACDQTMAKLLAAINAKAGSAYNYQYRQIDPVDGQDGGAPTGNIRVVQLFNANRVSFDDKAAPAGTNLSTAAVAVQTDAQGEPMISFSPGRIDPTNRAWANGNVTQPDGSVANFSGSRKPLVGEYTFNGRRVFVVSNHFNSRIGDDPLFGVNQPPRLLNEPQRREQALIVHNFVRDVLAIDAGTRVVVLGDFNEYDFGNPLRILRNGPLTSSGGDGSEPVLKNLSTELVTDPAERYSYVFDGNSQELDHILVSPALLSTTTQYQAVHLNAGYATQNSDHDPIVSSYVIAANLAPTANAGGDQTVSGGAAVTLRGSGSDSDGRIVGYAWAQTAGPAVTLSGANTATLSFTAPNSPATLRFSLTVTDDDRATGVDTATVTVPADTTPADFYFVPVTGAPLGSPQTSNAIAVGGINSPAPITVTGGRYSVNGGGFTTAAGTVRNGDAVQLQLDAATTPLTASQAALTIGGTRGTFSVTTAAAAVEGPVLPPAPPTQRDGGGALNPLGLAALLLLRGWRRRRQRRKP